MGNLCHAGPVLRAGEANGSSAATKPALTFGRDPNLKLEDYIFADIHAPCSLIKQPGSVNGQQFVIENCRDCDLFVMDRCASVQIDECVNCRLVIGPCESSLFLRNCKNCTIVCAVQQFRTRDCEDIQVYLYSATEPIIETSKHMRFACFPLSYFSLQHQLDAAKFSVWNNRWSEIYNFTPDHGSWKVLSAQCHESPLLTQLSASSTSATGSLWSMPSAVSDDLGLSMEVAQLAIPLTCSVSMRREDATSLVVVFTKPKLATMLAFANRMTVNNEGITDEPVLLIRTRQLKLTSAQADILLQSNRPLAQQAKEAAAQTDGSVVMEFQGAESYARLEAVLLDPTVVDDTTAIKSNIFWSLDSAMARRLSDLVFVEWKVTM